MNKCFFWHKPSQNILRLSDVLVQFSFTASEMELDYYHMKLDDPVGSRVAKSLKT